MEEQEATDIDETLPDGLGELRVFLDDFGNVQQAVCCAQGAV